MRPVSWPSSSSTVPPATFSKGIWPQWLRISRISLSLFLRRGCFAKSTSQMAANPSKEQSRIAGQRLPRWRRKDMVDRGPAEKSKGGDPSRARLRQKFPTIEDLRRKARKRVPRFGFDFVDGGATEEHCIRRNTDAFQEVHLLPHYCVEDKVSTETELFGKRYGAPIG